MSELPPEPAIATATPVLPTDDPAVRALVWQWFADQFTAAPDAAAVAWLIDGEGDLWLDLLGEDAALAAPLATARALLAADPDRARLVARLGVAFNRLFVGIGGPDTVSPCESAHVGDGRAFGPATTSMERLLARHDLHVAGPCREPADHLAVELTLLARFVATGDAERGAFVDRLRGWLPHFRAACAARDGFGFHAALADAVVAFLDREATAIEAAVRFVATPE